MNHSSISLCMIVKNEENCLERCLQSVQGIVDEIIIVDTGSTDKTKEIAKRYTQHIYDFKWINDFSAARNYALSFASSEYILQLDADELLQDPQKELSELDKDFYYLRIKNDLGSGMFLSHQFIRIFKNSSDIRYTGALHEQVSGDYPMERYGSLSSVVIFHEGYKAHLVKSKQKTQRNLNILLEEIKEKPTAFTYYNLGMQYIIEEKYNDALKALKKSYSLGTHFAFSQKVILDIMKCLQALGHYHEAIIIGEDAVILYEEVPDYWYQMGLVYMDWGMLKDAERCFKKCLEIGEENTHKLVQHYDGTGSYLAQAKLAEVKLALGDTENAVQSILSAVKDSPDTLALFDIFLSIFPNANNEELFRTIGLIWPFSSQRYIELIGYLYRRRSPLLNEFLNYFEMDVVYPVSVYNYIVHGDYEQAIAEISNHKERSAEQGAHLTYNLIFLAFATDNPGLIDQLSETMLLSSKEIKWLKKLLQDKKAGEVALTSDIRLIWQQLITDAIKLQEYELIDHLTVATNQPELRLLIAESLQLFGFDELALDVLVEADNQQTNRKIYMIAANSLRKLGAMEDALLYLKKAEKIKLDFGVLFEQWEIYKYLDENLGFDVLQKIYSIYPDSKWAKEEVEKKALLHDS